MTHHSHTPHEEEKEKEPLHDEPESCCGDSEDEEGVPEEEPQKKEQRWYQKFFKREWKNAFVGFLCGAVAMNLFSSFFAFDVSVRPKWSQSQQQGDTSSPSTESSDTISQEELSAAVFPKDGFVIPVRWGDAGKKLVETGVLDQDAFTALYAQRGGIPQDMQDLFTRTDISEVRITQENSGVLLNVLWALGIGAKNTILEKGPMSDPEYGGAAGFASTGGWTLARGDAMEHYSKHEYFTLTPEQQKRVEQVSQNIYRPCCGNSTYFPDCNHGMAMLGLLELMASQDMSEQDMYRVALQVNAYWFPETYLTIAKYLKKRGFEWQSVDPKEILGAAFSSAQGYKRILSEESPVQQQGGGGCGI
ncbi:MAG: hypothetical protein AAB855_00470 [Patescibacteria group bacterium]